MYVAMAPHAATPPYIHVMSAAGAGGGLEHSGRVREGGGESEKLVCIALARKREMRIE